MENRLQRNSLLRSSVFGVAALLIMAILLDWLRLDMTLSQLNAGTSQRIFDRYGQQIRHALSADGDRQDFLYLEEIPEPLRQAFILAEDQSFFTHSGVDARALLRGAFQSLRQRRKVSGGSTITMQLVRMQWPEIKGALHKPTQILQTLTVENQLSKGDILVHYLNRIPFGNKISGVGAACRYFFNKTCPQLSVSQMATLAILPRNPSLFTKNPAGLITRRNALLEKLVSKSEPQVLLQAKNETLEFTKTNPESFAPHLMDRILRERPKQKIIHTTLDLRLQQKLQEFLFAETTHRQASGNSGAILVLDNPTGQVLAYVGSPDFSEPSHGMVDGVRVRRSPGSALKPFVYELALENSWDLFSLLPDIPMVFSTQKAIYEPHNYGGNFSGPRTFRAALANSKNLPALYLTDQLGPAHVLEHLRRLGFSTLNQDATYYGVGLALGNGDVTLWDLVKAYSALARLGMAIEPTYYLDQPLQKERVLPEETAYLIGHVLKDPEARQEEFGRQGPLEFEYEVAVKTGTSSDYRDHWTLGFTRDVTVGVWRGNANSTPLTQRISASRGTGPLFHKVMDWIHQHRASLWMPQPLGLESSRVCTLSGKKPGPHCSITRTELHLQGRAPAHECDFHKTQVVPNCHGESRTLTYIQLPSEYAEWAKGSALPTLENQLLEKCGLKNLSNLNSITQTAPKIAEPLDRTVFALDPTMPTEHQEIRFSLRNLESREPTQMYVNDRPYQSLNMTHDFFWPLQRGHFKFYLKRGDQVSNVVHIHVR